jgi:triacylglycerol lipase
MIGINANYRLAPEHQWPVGAEDVGRSIAWARMHAAEYGGNPDRIIVMGHSSGASHVASYVFDKRFKPSTGSDGVVGAILLSGGYDPTRETTAGRRAYYGEDEATYPDRAAIRHVSESATPIFIGFAEYDPVRFQLEAVNLFAALCERDKRCPAMKQLTGHNHMTEIYHIGPTDQSLTQELIAFVNRVR